MKEHLFAITTTLLALGLFSGIMVEIYIRFFPEWLDFEAKSQSLKKEGELDKAIENLEPKVVQKDHESGEAIEMTSNDKNTQALC